MSSSKMVGPQPSNSIISGTRRHTVGVELGVMEDIRLAFEVCHAAGLLGAFFGLPTIVCTGNGLRGAGR